METMNEEITPRPAVFDNAAAVRAADHGIDYHVIMRTRSRVRRGAGVILGVVIVVIVGIALTQTSLVDTPLNTGTYLLAGAATAGAQLVAFIATVLIGRLAFARLDAMAQERAVAVVYVLATAAALAVAVSLVPNEPSAHLGALAGSLLGGIVSLSGVLSLPAILRTDSPAAAAAIAHYQQLPQWQTLLGGTTRFILAEMTLRIVTDLGIVLVAFGNPIALVPLAVFGVAATLAGAYCAARDRPRATVMTAATYAAAALIVALAVSS
jgi:hypothetical protein